MSGKHFFPHNGGGHRATLVLLLIILSTTLMGLFHRSFLPHEVLFSNDATFGAMKAEAAKYPQVLLGYWHNLGWLGSDTLFASPNISGFFNSLLRSPELFSKIYVPFTLLFLGLSAWLFFRELDFHPAVCVLGGLAAGLNSHAFSTACWGLGPWNLAIATTFLAMAAIVTKRIHQSWAKASLAGLAVGLTVMEGFDVGAILSIATGIFVFFWVWASAKSPTGKKALASVGTVIVVVVFAVLMSFHTVSGLIGTQIKGITGLESDNKSKESRWNFATQWSLPKKEALRVIIPGVFGYRMVEHISDSDKSSSYWGRIASDPTWELLDSSNPEDHVRAAQSLGLNSEFVNALASSDRNMHDQALQMLKSRLPLQRRHSGSGEYAGILVGLLALFGLTSSLRKSAVYTEVERRCVWFWSLAAFVSLLLAFGRHGFLYQFIYQLPYFSTIRNPIKFLHPFHIAWIVMAGYGLEALCRRHLEVAGSRSEALSGHLKNWWAKAVGFEKKWAVGLVLALIASTVLFLILGSSKAELAKHLEGEGFSGIAPQIAGFFIRELGLFLLFFGVSAGVMITILSGAWAGSRAKWAWIVLGVIMVTDLSRADAPWIRYFDYKFRYASNPAIDFLKEKPYEYRVTAEKAPLSRAPLTDDQNFFVLYYDWLQNHFLAENIQSLDIIQMPRKPAFDGAFMDAFAPRNPEGDLASSVRLWKLTNTRYMLGSTNLLSQLNASDPEHGFSIRMPLEMVEKQGVTRVSGVEDLTVKKDEKGRFGLIELKNTLPRAKLYAHWQWMTNDTTTLKVISSPDFDMHHTVMLAEENRFATAPVEPESDPGTVTIVDYHPKNIKLQAMAKRPVVLLLNDRTSPNWKVLVDGKPADMLRCNYIMRGVFLPTAGEHTIEFRFQPSLMTFYVSLSAWGVGLVLAGFLVVNRRKGDAESVFSAAQPDRAKTI